jgi:two-component system chemotaxis response regulator CheB
LSGASSDGAEGLKAISDAGGQGIVQIAQTAEFPAMPQAAIELNHRAIILEPANIAQHLINTL